MRQLIDRQVLFFGGKGGVGKTTCASATALAASRMGRRVLLVSTDPAHSTSDIFERAIGAEPSRAAAVAARDGDRRGNRVAPLRGRRQGAHRGKLFGHSILREANRQIDLAATMPGAEEVALFDRMGALIRGEDQRFDLIVFDTAPTGHTLRLIRMPELMEAWIKALSRSRRAMLGVGSGGSARSDHDVAERSARSAARAAGAPRQRAYDRVRARADPRAAADRGDRARDRRSSTKPACTSATLVVNRVLPDTTEDAFLNARRGRSASISTRLRGGFRHTRSSASRSWSRTSTASPLWSASARFCFHGRRRGAFHRPRRLRALESTIRSRMAWPAD